MFDVSHKPDTAREAYAQAILWTKNQSTISAIKEGQVPKGDVLQAARVAGTMAAKKTWDIIPYCHSIPIDYVSINFSFEDADSAIAVYCKVKSVWKTGVEMEAITGATVAALTIYDMVKPVDDSIQINRIKLLHKSGGLSDLYAKTGGNQRAGNLKAAVIVVSDTRSQSTDESGKLIVDRLSDHFKIVDYKVIPDDFSKIQSDLERLCDIEKVDLVLTSGGTGIGSRDVTPQATTNVIDIELKGVSEALRMHGQRRTPMSMLSRGIAGLRKGTIIVNLPGSVNSISESLDVLFPALSHAFEVLHGLQHKSENHTYEHKQPAA